MEIIWTKLAKATYFEIIENLNLYWNKNKSNEFIKLTNQQLNNIKKGTIKYRTIINSVRKCVIHKNISLYYKEIDNKIILITFFNNRMNPKSLLKLLK